METTPTPTPVEPTHRFKVGDYIQASPEWSNKFFGIVLGCYSEQKPKDVLSFGKDVEYFYVIGLMTENLKTKFIYSELHDERINHAIAWEPTVVAWTPKEQTT